eukprot:1159810-Pelagomonas_calceolata.AAC.19
MARQQLLNAGEQERSDTPIGNLLGQPPHIARPAENYDQVRALRLFSFASLLSAVYRTLKG